jgi:hypothetical protein
MTVKNRSDLISGLVVLAGVGIMFHQSTLIDVAVAHAGGPTFFPRILLGLLAVLSLTQILRSVSWDAPAAETASSDKISGYKPAIFKLQAGLIGLVCLYLAAMPFLGYAVSTVLFLIASMYLLGKRSLKQLAVYTVVSIITAALLDYTFGHLLQLFLP